ncbi:MAG: rRNA (guanine745-N1)-methyltransferase [Actinomycetota bacterium]|jgi:23S rRNA (guanine745-N1)-methyltransferase
MLACPLDLQPLTRTERVWRCSGNHSYDEAREGYVNLLPPGRPSRKNAGDDKASVDARRRFLNAGHYEVLAAQLSAITDSLTPDAVLDVGCGEGYYTGWLRAREVAGVDISHAGIRLAARAHPSIAFAIGNAAALPVVTASADVAVSVFAPIDPEEFARVVAPGGHAVVAVPGADHLAAIRSLLYVTPQPHDEALPELGARFELVDTQRLAAEITVDEDTRRDLLTMTPYRFAVPPEALERAHRHEGPTTTPISFLVARYRRRSG